jgi:hypothetical protein
MKIPLQVQNTWGDCARGDAQSLRVLPWESGLGLQAKRKSMIRKSVQRLSEQIMLNQELNCDDDSPDLIAL